MKQKSLLKTVFLLAALLVGSSAWADEATITWNINGVNTTASGAPVNTTLKTSSVTGGSGTWTAVSSENSYAASNNSGAQLGSGSYAFNGTITLSGSTIPNDATIKSIGMTIKSTAGSGKPYTVSAKVNNTTFGSNQTVYNASGESSPKDYTFSGSVIGNSIVLTFSCESNKNVVISKLTVTYEVTTPIINASSPVNYVADITSGEIPYTISNPVSGKSLNANSDDNWISNISVGADKVTFSMEENTGAARVGTITLSYDGATSKTITVNQAAAVSKYTVTIVSPTNGTLAVMRGDNEITNGSQIPDGTVLTIVPTPAAGYKFKNWQAVDGSTHTYTQNYTYTISGHDVTFKANFEAKSQYTYTWSVNGTVVNTETLYEGTDVVFPSVDGISGKVFYGWVTTSTVDPDENPSLVTTTGVTATANTTYYAVFATLVNSIPESWTETALSTLGTNDVFVFSYNNYAMTNDNGASTAPAASAIDVEDNKITSTVTDNLKWKVSGNATDGYTFYPNGSTTTWLYCNTTANSSSNNNIRVGTGDRKVWEVVAPNGYLKTKDTNTARYLSLYNNSDFRGYTNTDNNPIVPKFYKYIPASLVANDFCTIIPIIALSTNLVEATAAETEGTIDLTYTAIDLTEKPAIEWYTDATATTAITDNDEIPTWIQAEINSSNNLYYVIGDNEGAARTAYMKVFAIDYNNTNFVYSELITITQAAATVNVTVSDAGWATYAPANPVSFAAGTAYIINSATNSEVTLTQVDDVPAETPVLLKGTKGTATPATMTVIASSNTNVASNCLHVSDGTAKDNIFVLANGADGVGFYLWTGDSALPSGKIYLALPSGARTFIGLPGDETAIENVKANVNQNENYYDLQGRRVAQPTKGLYIVNGKKVVIK